MAAPGVGPWPHVRLWPRSNAIWQCVFTSTLAWQHIGVISWEMLEWKRGKQTNCPWFVFTSKISQQNTGLIGFHGMLWITQQSTITNLDFSTILIKNTSMQTKLQDLLKYFKVILRCAPQCKPWSVATFLFRWFWDQHHGPHGLLGSNTIQKDRLDQQKQNWSTWENLGNKHKHLNWLGGFWPTWDFFHSHFWIIIIDHLCVSHFEKGVILQPWMIWVVTDNHKPYQTTWRQYEAITIGIRWYTWGFADCSSSGLLPGEYLDRT